MNKLEFRMDIPAVTREYTPGLPPSHPLMFSLDLSLTPQSDAMVLYIFTSSWHSGLADRWPRWRGRGGAECLFCQLKASGPQYLGARFVLCEVDLIKSASNAVCWKLPFPQLIAWLSRSHSSERGLPFTFPVTHPSRKSEGTSSVLFHKPGP